MPPRNSLEDFASLQRAFCDYLRDPDKNPPPQNIEQRRLAVYRHAIFSNVEGLLKDNYPRVRAIFDDEQWQALVRHYIINHQSLATAFVDVPKEFLKYLDSANVFPELPAFIQELAHFDWLETLVGADLREIDQQPCNREADLMTSIPVVNPVLRLVKYSYPVHAINQDYHPLKPPEQPTHIAAFRDRQNHYGFLDINPLAARLLELMDANESETGMGLMARLAEEFNFADAASLAQSALPILTRMVERDVILGSRPD